MAQYRGSPPAAMGDGNGISATGADRSAGEPDGARLRGTEPAGTEHRTYHGAVRRRRAGRPRRRSQRDRHRHRVPDRSAGRRRPARAAAGPGGALQQARAERRRRWAAAVGSGAGGRRGGQPAAAADRLHRHLPPARGEPGAVSARPRRDGAGPAAPAGGGQGAFPRHHREVRQRHRAPHAASRARRRPVRRRHGGVQHAQPDRARHGAAGGRRARRGDHDHVRGPGAPSAARCACASCSPRWPSAARWRRSWPPRTTR